MRWRLFNALALLSLLAAAMLGAEWVRSQFRTDLFVTHRNYIYQMRGTTAGVYVLRIGLYFTPARKPIDLANPVLLGPRRFLPANRNDASPARWSYVRIAHPTLVKETFGWHTGTTRVQAYDQSANLQEQESLMIALPWWLLVLLASAIPTWWLVTCLMRKRSTPGFPIAAVS